MPWYFEALASGSMARSGAIEVISGRGARVAWKGTCLPGAWLIHQATELALERVAQHGVVTLTIAGAHETGALATYLPRVTERGLMPGLRCSGPAATGVAPFGGTRVLFTPNPPAAGIPMAGDPVLMDIGSSITSSNRARHLARSGERFSGALWTHRAGPRTIRRPWSAAAVRCCPWSGSTTATRATVWRCWARR